MHDILVYALCFIGAYFLGSISPAIIISDNFYSRADVRNYGSGNAGTTNMMRSFGWRAGVCTFLLDILKGAMGAFFGRYFGEMMAGGGDVILGGDLGALFACTGITLGHLFPIYYGFKGGKGIAAAAGMLLVLMPLPAVVALVIAIAIILLGRIASVGSLTGVTLCVIAAFVFYPHPERAYMQLTIIIIMVLTFFAHRANLVRLFKGQENKLNLFKKKEKSK